jgi:hypothetical protein
MISSEKLRSDGIRLGTTCSKRAYRMSEPAAQTRSVRYRSGR